LFPTYLFVVLLVPKDLIILRCLEKELPLRVGKGWRANHQVMLEVKIVANLFQESNTWQSGEEIFLTALGIAFLITWLSSILCLFFHLESSPSLPDVNVLSPSFKDQKLYSHFEFSIQRGSRISRGKGNVKEASWLTWFPCPTFHDDAWSCKLSRRAKNILPTTFIWAK